MNTQCLQCVSILGLQPLQSGVVLDYCNSDGMCKYCLNKGLFRFKMFLFQLIVHY